MNGTPVPRPGLGTSGNTDPDQCAESVATALDLGYRHVDTAQMYDNEAAVGDGIAEAGVHTSEPSGGSPEGTSDGVNRDEVFLATKILPDNLAHDDVLRTAAESLDRLGVESVDLLYVHWPTGAYEPEETLPAFDELVDEGLVEHVGVSNFTPDLMAEARDILDAPIVAHQVEMHPLLPQEELLAEAREHDTALVAYAPMLQGGADEVPELVEIGEKHDASAAQVSLAWLLSKDGVVPIPKATGREHLAENLAARDLDLDGEDIEKIDGIGRERRLIDPDAAAWNR